MLPYMVWLHEAGQLSRMHHLRKEEEAATLLINKVCQYVNITRKRQPYYRASSLILTLIPMREPSTSCTLACRKYTPMSMPALTRHLCKQQPSTYPVHIHEGVKRHTIGYTVLNTRLQATANMPCFSTSVKSLPPHAALFESPRCQHGRLRVLDCRPPASTPPPSLGAGAMAAPPRCTQTLRAHHFS